MTELQQQFIDTQYAYLMGNRGLLGDFVMAKLRQEALSKSEQELKDAIGEED